MKKITFYLSIALIMLTSSLLWAQNSKDEIFNRLSKKYSNISTVQISFISKDNPHMAGSVKAKRGNKYILKSEGHEFICNGKTIWNYDYQNNKVIKSEFEAQNSEASLENIFFSFIKDYYPDNLYTENSSKAGSSYSVLVLKPKNEKKKISGIKELKLNLNIKSLNISAIYITQKNKTHGWNITGINTNIKIPDSYFNFKIPKNAKVIELK